MVTETKEPITQRVTSTFEKIGKAYYDGKRRVFLEGGTWSSKTFSVIQFLKLLLQHTKEPLLASVVSESVPHLKRGAIRDFVAIMGDDLLDKEWNRSDFIYTFPNATLEFFSADTPSKLRGGRRDVLFINEANNIPYDSYRELDMRTRSFTICDWNPVSEFWFHENHLDNLTENEYIHTTYRDALEVVPQSVRDDIESYKDTDPNWYRVYGLGLVGKLEGLVYPHFEMVDLLPVGLPYFYGLDYGTVDPTVLVKNVVAGDKLYSQEMLYEPLQDVSQIARKIDLLKIGNAPIYPDPDEPFISNELIRRGIPVRETEKGKGSVEYGIQKVNQYQQFWTKDSLNCIKEQRNYRYLQDKDGHLTEKTTHRWSHGLDARRYAVASYRKVMSGSKGISVVGLRW